MQRDATLLDVTSHRYWQIADFHHVYSREVVTPVEVMKNVISALDGTQAQDPKMHLLITRDTNDMMKQAAESRERCCWSAAICHDHQYRAFTLLAC